MATKRIKKGVYKVRNYTVRFINGQIELDAYLPEEFIEYIASMKKLRPRAHVKIIAISEPYEYIVG